MAICKRRWFQFRITTLLLLVAGLAAWLAFYYSAAMRQGRAAKALERAGVSVMYDYQHHSGTTTYSTQVEPPGASWVRKVISADFFQTAQRINLHNTALAAEDLRPLEDLPGLRHAYLVNCRIDDRHMAHFRGLRRMEELTLGINQISDEGLAPLAGMHQLQTLSLSGNRISGAGLRHVGTLSRLEQLFLQENPIEDDGLAFLAESRSLEMIGLAGTKITDDGLKHLEDLPNVRYLGLGRTKVTKAAVERLRAKWPQCEVEHY